ncbi:glycosyl transferase family 39 [Isosphaera pallida ATCC 43644]|uniref:Glycosyl transferase family 39 n=1 Tax=Isosphaera pallida (strain ATCC 43644 / DSM 9630 / IS1B) TaxID=575540 RepID=E8QYV2_ISOPI|nr:glycosyltransferase family 39 protein [Isosphaera pallida]ADV62089.1 glycosyl transferase family 39 [Isosphaera pallida ATCC 43644]
MTPLDRPRDSVATDSVSRLARMVSMWTTPAALGLLSLSLAFLGNASTPLWDRDEPRYAVCAREMGQSGDYIRPTYNAEPRHQKPVLIYWLMQPGRWLAGDTPFGARLTSGVMGMLTVLLVWSTGQRLHGPGGGLWPGLILATMPLMVVESKLATTDATLAFFVTLSFRALWELSQNPPRHPSFWAAVFWIAQALGILTKGPVAPAVLIASSLTTLALGGRCAVVGWSRLKWKWGPLLALVIAAPWYVAIELATQGEFSRQMIGYHVIERATRDLESHGGFPGFYVVGLIGLCFPWSVLFGPMLRNARRELKTATDPNRVHGLAFWLGAVLGPLMLFELARTKLIHYILPVLPPLALLVGDWLKRRLDADRHAVVVPASPAEIARDNVSLSARWPRWGLRLGAALIIPAGIAAAVLPSQTTLAALSRSASASPWPSWSSYELMIPWPIGLGLAAMSLSLGVASLTAASTLREPCPDWLRAAKRLALGSTLALFILGGWVAPIAGRHTLAWRLAKALERRERAENLIPVMVGYRSAAVVHMVGHPLPMPENLEQLLALVEQHGAVQLGIDPRGLPKLKADPRFGVERLEDLAGFDAEKGCWRDLVLVRLTTRRVPLLAQPIDDTFNTMRRR